MIDEDLIMGRLIDNDGTRYLCPINKENGQPLGFVFNPKNTAKKLTLNEDQIRQIAEQYKVQGVTSIPEDFDLAKSLQEGVTKRED